MRKLRFSRGEVKIGGSRILGWFYNLSSSFAIEKITPAQPQATQNI